MNKWLMSSCRNLTLYFVEIIKYDFGLTIDIEDLIHKIDTDDSGEIEFDEFSVLLSP